MAIVDCDQDAVCPFDRCALCSSVLRHGGSGGRATSGRRGSAGEQGVPVVLPVRKGSPGGSYGTAAEWHALCPAVFPVGVRLVGQGCGSSVDQP